MSGRLGIAVIVALLVELPSWTKVRWDFSEEAQSRAWQLTSLLILLTGVMIYLDGVSYLALPRLVTWLPALLLPMQFVQGFGLKDSVAVNTFSFLAKQRKLRNARLGLTEQALRVNFGNIYFVAVLVASTLGSRANEAAFWGYLPGLLVLSGWMLLSAGGRNKPVALVTALTVAAGIAVAGQIGLQRLEDLFRSPGQKTSFFDPNSTSTLVGQRGKVQQTPDIQWRLHPSEKMRAPSLLRTASYNSYGFGSWKIESLPARKFEELSSLIHDEAAYYSLMPENYTGPPTDAVKNELPRFTLRGGVSPESPLPLPGDATSVRDFELDGIERNSQGTVRVFPKHSVVEGMVLWKGDLYTEGLPQDHEDRIVPNRESKVLESVVEELKLRDLPTLDEKLKVVKGWFFNNFQYTRDLTIARANNPKFPTPLAQFLTTTRAGHCEYFATAATLIMRQAGIPARYTIGFALSEWDAGRKEFVIRGTHAHAWSRVWDQDAGKWVDFDVTPPSWIDLVSQLKTPSQRFYDTVQRLREDFFIWRNRPANRLGVSLAMLAIGLGVLGFVMKRLWKSKRRLEEERRKAMGYGGPVAQTPLNLLESVAAKHLGERPPGKPFAAWLQGLNQTLPDTAALAEAIDLHQRLRFDPEPQQESAGKRLAELAKELEGMLKRKV